MIKAIRYGDIFDAMPPNIAYPINIEGTNDDGFAGLIARKFGVEVKAPSYLGDVQHLRAEGIDLYPMALHSLGQNGWYNFRYAYRRAVERMWSVEVIHLVLPGAGPVGRMQGADIRQIVSVIDAEPNLVVLYSQATDVDKYMPYGVRM